MATARYPDVTPVPWPLALPADTGPERVAELRTRAEALAEAAQYGWGHSIDFGAFRMPGLLGDKYLRLAAVVDRWGWWDQDLTGKRVADVGAFTGGLTALLAARGAEVAAVDEVPEHLRQCELLVDAFGLTGVTTHERSLYTLREEFEPESLDIILCAGVLYHVSDMLVALIELQRLLKPGGSLIIETNAVESFEHSYANFGRYVGGMWWQPTALCVADLHEHAGFERPDAGFYQPGRLLTRAVKPAEARIPFRRGLNLPVDSLRDDVERGLDPADLAPAPDLAADAGMLRRFLFKAAARLLRLPMELGYRYRRFTRRSRRAE